MAKIDDFINEVVDIYHNHGVYIWGGNGEHTVKLSIHSINAMETSQENTARVLAYISKCYDKGYDMSKSKAVDCSGLCIAALRKIGAIKPSADYRARDLQAMCEKIELRKLKPGDCVFNKTSGATHMGIFDGFKVIEAQGRDVGVTRRDVSAGSWVIGGRLPYFK